jgi:hypothetical protein
MYMHGKKTGCRATLEYTYRGMRVGFLENDLLRVGVLIDKGGDLFELTCKPRDVDFLWQSPIDLRTPFVVTNAPPEGSFHDLYHGGWQEVLPSAGFGADTYRGAPQGLHGELPNLPLAAEVIGDDPERVSLRLTAHLYRSPLTLVRTMTLSRGSGVLMIDEELVNHSTDPFAVMWGHHPALGEPFLDDSCILQAPASSVDILDFQPDGLWEPGVHQGYPMVRNRRSGALEDVCAVRPKGERSVDFMALSGLEEGWFAVTNRRLQLGIGFAFDPELFKYLWVWQLFGGHRDYPWYGRGYALAVEPFTSWPPSGIADAVRLGTARVLPGDSVLTTHLAVVVYEGDPVRRIGRDGIVER